jgi:hypothetical protein
LQFALGIALLVYLGMLFVAAYDDNLGSSLAQAWAMILAVPTAAGLMAHGWHTPMRLALPAPIQPRLPLRRSATRPASVCRPDLSQPAHHPCAVCTSS